jgi:hypothetical protein
MRLKQPNNAVLPLVPPLVPIHMCLCLADATGALQIYANLMLIHL